MELLPFVGLGTMRFGMTRAEARGALGDNYRSFRKVPAAPTLTDAYADLGLHLYYDPADRLEFIEAFKPAQPTFRSIELLAPTDDVLKRLLQSGAGPARRDLEAYFFHDHGFALYSPGPDVEGVSVFTKGYYLTMAANPRMRPSP